MIAHKACLVAHLQELELLRCQPAEYAVLTSLGRLARLWLADTEHLPACLPQLTGLQELILRTAGHRMDTAAFQAAVDAALQQLTNVSAQGARAATYGLQAV